jgi:hypothetical protein
MKNMLLNNDVVQLWKEANTFLEYVIALWFTIMVAIAAGGFSYLIVKWIMNPNMWDGVQFGIYDYLG